MLGVLPNFKTFIEDTWIPTRRSTIFNHFAAEGLYPAN